MTVSTVTDSMNMTAAYSATTQDRKSPDIASSRNAAASRPLILASLPLISLMTTAAAETTGTAPSRNLGDLVDRQDAFNGAEGCVEGDTIRLKADSQNDAGLAINLKKPISGRLSFYCGTGSSETIGSNYSVTLQFIKAGPDYNYTRDKILDQKCINPQQRAEEMQFSIPEGTDKIVVMKVGRGSFNVEIHNIEMLKPVTIPPEAICEELRDSSIKLQYYPRVKYNSSRAASSATVEILEFLDEEQASKNYAVKVASRSASSGGVGYREIELNLTRGTMRVKDRISMGPGYKSEERLCGVGDKGEWPSELKKEFVSNLGDLISQLKPSDAETPPEIQTVIKLLEGYIAKHNDAE